MFELPRDLLQALQQVTAEYSEAELARSTERLIERYRADRPAKPGELILVGPLAVAAYLAYRMPATYAAVRTALSQLPEWPGESAVLRHVDVGGGTGAAVWAVADCWPQIGAHRVVEQSTAAIAIGRRLVEQAASESVRATEWTQATINASFAVPPADLVTISYVLSELAPPMRQALVASAAGAANLLVVVEPGTVAGYQRIIDARSQLIAQGLHIVAPCPHDEPCPIGADRDWCHFDARVIRTALHRRIKLAEKSFEDEKFSYLIASKIPIRRADNRILRHPVYAKGRVLLTLCESDPGVQLRTVSKRNSDSYRAARDAQWGDTWPPTAQPPEPNS